MSYLDTNYLVRYFTNDIPKLAEVAKKVIEKGKNLYIPQIVLAETVYILENDYKSSKQEVCRVMLVILKQDNITTPKFSLQAFDIYQKENIDFYDCLVIAEALSSKGKLHTFDKKMMKVYKKYFTSSEA